MAIAELEPLQNSLRLSWKGLTASVKLLLADRAGTHTKFRKVSQSSRLGEFLAPQMEEVQDLASGLFHLCQAWGQADVTHRRSDGYHALAVDLQESSRFHEYPYRAQLITHLRLFPMVRLDIRFRNPSPAPAFYAWKEVPDCLEIRMKEIWRELALYQAWKRGLAPLALLEKGPERTPEERAQLAAALADAWSRGTLPPTTPGVDRLPQDEALYRATTLWGVTLEQVQEYLRFIQSREG